MLGGRFKDKIQDAVNQGRGDKRPGERPAGEGATMATTADDRAVREAQTFNTERMVVPDGVVIEGAMTSGSETEIAGRIEGAVTVENRLIIAQGGVVTGEVHATVCRVDGVIEGVLECTQNVDIGNGARLNSGVVSGKDMSIGGQVEGNVNCAGLLRLGDTAMVKGNIRARSLVIEEGAVINGVCSMLKPKQAPQKGKPAPQGTMQAPPQGPNKSPSSSGQ